MAELSRMCVMKDLSGQIAVITGASSGIGRAIALCLSEQGMTLCLVGRNPQSLESVVGEAGKAAPKVYSYLTDFTNDQDVEELIQKLRGDVPEINVFIHCAGVLKVGRVEQLDLMDFDAQYRTNVRAPYALTKALLPLIQRGSGQIVMMNSSVWQQARSGLSQYAATKYALKAFTDSLRDEVNQSGVRVLSVFLGRTATPMQAALHQQEEKPYHPDVLIQPEDVALTVRHLLTLPYSSEVTDIHIRPMRKPPI